MNHLPPFRLSQNPHPSILDHFPEAVIIFNNDLTIQYANALASQLMQKPIADLLNKHYQNISPPENHDLFTPYLEMCYQSGQAQKGHCTLMIEGKPLQLLVSYAPHYTETGDVEHVIGTYTTIPPQQAPEIDYKVLQENFRLLFEDNPLPMLVYAADNTTILEANLAFLEKFEYDLYEVIGQPMKTLLHPSASARLQQSITDYPHQSDYHFKRVWQSNTKHGKPLNIVTDSRSIQFMNRAATVMVIYDIAQQIHFPHNIGELQAGFTLLFDNNPLPMWVFDLETLAFLAVNKSAIQKYGYTVDEFLSMTIKEIRPSSEFEKLSKALENAENEILYFGNDWRHITKDHRILEVATNWHRINFLGHNAALVVVEDLTEKNRVLHALRDSESKWRTIFQESLDVMLVIEPDSGIIIEVNIAVQGVLGYHPDELRGQHFSIIQPFATDNIWADNNLMERPFKNRQGDFIDMDVTMFIIPWNNEFAVIASLRDASTRLKLAENRRESERLTFQLANEKELRAMRARFFGMLAHDIRNPLASITLSVGMLLEYWEKMEVHKRERRLLMITEQLSRMNDLLDDALSVSQLDSFQLDFRPDNNDLIPLCEKLYIEFWEKTKQNYQLHFQSNAKEINLPLDAKIMRRALENLLSNAFKYSPNGGAVTFEIIKEAYWAIIHISDEGIGIAPEDQINLFEPFYRASNVRDIHGTGLGLSIVKQIVELHGGQISLESQLNQGSHFIIRLPLTRSDD